MSKALKGKGSGGALLDFGTILGSDCRGHRTTMRKEAWGCHSSGQPPLLGPGPGKRGGWGTQGRKGRLGTPERRLAWVAEPFHQWSRWGDGCFAEDYVGALGTWVS